LNATEHKTQRLVGFQAGTREAKYFEKFFTKISSIDAKIYVADG
jgi:hypothetical protein